MLHWTKLKKMVEDAGGTWTNREEAEEFLRHLGTPVIEPEAPAPAPKAAVLLDRSRPYGEIFGDVEGVPGARYSQDKRLFNAAGEQVG